MAVKLDNPELVRCLERCRELPSPPGVAEEIINLSNLPNSNIAMLAEVVSMDPALTVKILRMANSSMYARQGKVESLEQAVIMFGWNGTLNLALSFSLISKGKNSTCEGLDYAFYWRRSISAAVAAKHLANLVGINSRRDDLFLPGLLQDIGMLVLDKVHPDLYLGVGDRQHQHKFIQQLERDKIGVDHATVGAWLLNRWHLPQRIVDLVSISHQEEMYESDENNNSAEHCMKVSNALADCICSDEDKKDYQHAAKVAESLLGIDKENFIENLKSITDEILETAVIFEVDVGDPKLLNCIAEQAREMLLMRSMEILKNAEELHQTAEVLESKTRELEDLAKKDSLTNIYNRRYLEVSLAREFQISKSSGWPLSVVMIDLDNFKTVNDTYGHGCGDKVLKYAVCLLETCVRGSDSLYRYGGEEFVVVLPNTGEEGAEAFSKRIIEAYNRNEFEYNENIKIPVTASIGIAVHGEGVEFDTYDELVNIADYCLYASKANGRNQYTLYREDDSVKAAVG